MLNLSVESERDADVLAGMKTICPSKDSQHAFAVGGMQSMEWKQLYWARVGGILLLRVCYYAHELVQGTLCSFDESTLKLRWPG